MLPFLLSLLIFLSPTPAPTDYANLPDDDLHKFVSVGMPFHDLSYQPSDLVPLTSIESLRVQGERTLRKEASDQLIQLSLAFYETFHQPLLVVSAYRSYQYQKNQISEECKQTRYCAREGESEHQLGLAVDLWETTNEEKFLSSYQTYYDRLKNNAHLYGFHQSYQKGKIIDGYAIEPRHWRYLGIDLATKLHERRMTFSELVN